MKDSNNRFMKFIFNDYSLIKLDEAIEKFSLAADEYKIEKLYKKQIECLLKIDEIYDKKYTLTRERLDKKFQSTNLKNLIDLMLKENKKNILVDSNFIPFDVLSYVNKFIIISEETADDDHVIKSIDYIIKLYENVDDEIILILITELYEKQFEITQKYNEKYGDILIKKGLFKKAAELYESIGNNNGQSSTLKFSCSRLFLKAICCYILCDDDVYAKNKFDEIEISYPTIHNDRDFKLSKNIMDTYLEKDINTFTSNLIEYDEISKLSDFHVNLFNLIKKKMCEVIEEPDLC